MNLENLVLYVAFTMGKASSLDLSTDFCKSAFHGGSVIIPHAKCINFNGHQYGGALIFILWMFISPTSVDSLASCQSASKTSKVPVLCFSALLNVPPVGFGGDTFNKGLEHRPILMMP